MRTEVPVFKRCCFCLPLRRSLIAWGYFKLMIASILMLYCLTVLYQIINVFVKIRYQAIVNEIITFTMVFLMAIVDIILHIIFLVGAHKKEVKFLRVYYFYSLTLLVLTLVLDLISAGFMIRYGIYRYIDILFFSAWAVMFLNLLTQAYIILLVRSEIVKLNDIGSFRFVNNAAEAECKLQIVCPHEDKDKSNTDQEESNENIV